VLSPDKNNLNMTISINNIRNTRLAYVPRTKQVGLSLIELMISMVMGVFLLAGVVTNFIGTKDSDRTRAAISEMDANARTALSILRQTITHAGYPSTYNIRLDNPFYVPSDGTLSNATCRGGINRDVYTPRWWQRSRDSGRTDVLTIVTLADNPCKAGKASCPDPADANPDALVYYDCLGGGVTRDNRSVACSAEPDVGMADPTKAKIYSTFWLRASNRTLYCKGSRAGTQPLVENVEYIQFLYGVKQDDGTTSYRRANKVEADKEWGLVTSVQVALLIRSSQKNILKTPSEKKWYTLLDVRRRVADGDLTRLFKVYTTTINLENKNKGPL